VVFCVLRQYVSVPGGGIFFAFIVFFCLQCDIGYIYLRHAAMMLRYIERKIPMQKQDIIIVALFAALMVLGAFNIDMFFVQ
jgi:hypothetical protein